VMHCLCRFNFVNKASTSDTPAELPVEMATEILYDAGSFWHNSVTKESSWEVRSFSLSLDGFDL
jgi:hypothetical protein